MVEAGQTVILSLPVAGKGYDRSLNHAYRKPPVIKPNYAFEKRQRELAKKKKKAEKESRKSGADETPAEHPEVPAAPDAAGETPAADQP